MDRAKVVVFAIFVVFLLFEEIKSTSSDPTVVSIPNGLLQGEQREKYVAFEGVPYAAPPIGENRFEPPKPYTNKWEEVWNATRPREMCLQWFHFFFDKENKLRGNEDCLFLNVYVPLEKPETPLPVLYWVHGGAFIYGDGHFYLPDHLIDMPMIFVSINHRLGPLGFLTTEDEVVPGNMGMKDQVMALQWVNDNIAAFGGDPKRIYLSGFSAGGASVHLHYFSPLSQHLFKAGISHSGSALCPWVNMEAGREKAYTVADLVGCPSEDHKEMIKCLKRKPAEDIVSKVGYFQPFLFNPFSPFGITVEPDHEGAFISKSPYDAIREGDFKHAPWIVSATESEGLYPVGEFLMKKDYLEQINEQWDQLARHILDYNYSLPTIYLEPAARAIKEHYLGSSDAKFDRDTFDNLTQMVSDRLYNFGIMESARYHSKMADTYLYRFFYNTSAVIPVTETDAYGRLEELGVCHGEDVFLLIEPRHVDNYKLSADDKKMGSELLDIYWNFMKGKSPKSGGFDLAKFNDEGKYTIIEGPAKYTISNASFGEIGFWKGILLSQ